MYNMVYLLHLAKYPFYDIKSLQSRLFAIHDWFILRFINESNIDHINQRPEVKTKESKHVRGSMTSLVPTSKERRKFKIDRDRALKEFLENRLLNDTFMDNFRLDDLRAVGNKFYKGSRVEFQTIWDETLTLVNKLKSIEMIDYGKKWVHMIYKHSADNRQEILLFYVEALMLNRVIEQMKMSEDNKVSDMYGVKSSKDYIFIKSILDFWHQCLDFVNVISSSHYF